MTMTPGRGSIHPLPPPTCTMAGVRICVYVRGLICIKNYLAYTKNLSRLYYPAIVSTKESISQELFSYMKCEKLLLLSNCFWLFSKNTPITSKP